MVLFVYLCGFCPLTIVSQLHTVDTFFGGLLRQSVYCQTCESRSTRLEAFAEQSLSLTLEDNPVTQNVLSLSNGNMILDVYAPLLNFDRGGRCDLTQDVVSLESLLRSHFMSENLIGVNQYVCDHCKMKTNAIREVNIQSTPELLLLVLKRYGLAVFWNFLNTSFILLFKCFSDSHLTLTLK